MSPFRRWVEDRAPLIAAGVVLALAVTVLIVVSVLRGS
jgi:hypothetical protein